MKNVFIRLAIYQLLLFAFLSQVISQPVNIPDPGLRAAIETALGKNAGDTITQSEMRDERLKVFSASRRNISNLTGLEYATSIKLIYLEWNAISDLSPLSNLTGLEHLHLEHNQITDMSPLSNITNLESLNISYNNLTSLDGLPDLSSTYALFFQNNQITNLQPLIDHSEYTGIGKTHTKVLNLNGNPLDEDSVNTHIPHLLFDRFIDINFKSTFLKKFSGDNQTTTINTQLEPFVVEVSNHKGEKVNDTTVRFILTSGSGSFADGSNDGNNEILNTKTDSNGKAAGTLTTGSAIGTYRITVQVREHRSNSLFATSGVSFTVNVIEVNTSNPKLDEESQPLREDTVQQEEQEETPSQQQDEQPTQQQKEQEETQSQVQEEQPTQQQKEQEEQPTQQQEEQPTQQQKEQEEQPTQQQQKQEIQKTYTDQTQNEQTLVLDEEVTDTASPLSKLSYKGQISFSEVMFISKDEQDILPQWIELYNASKTEITNLKGWKLNFEILDKNGEHQYNVITFEDLLVTPQSPIILVTKEGRSSQDIQFDKVYNLNKKHIDSFDIDSIGCKVLGDNGFYLKISDPDGNVSDVAGNLDGDGSTLDVPLWKLPSGLRSDKERTSLIRRYAKDTGLPLDGTLLNNWKRACDLKLTVVRYWGKATDIGNPSYKGSRPLPVTLSYFSAEQTEFGVVIKWTTESETDNAGFNILRSQSEQGTYFKVNPKLIQGAGTTSERNTYVWTDITATLNVEYFYQIEDVSNAGKRNTLAKIRMKGIITPKNRLITSWGQLKVK